VLNVALPPWAATGGQVLIQYGPSEIREYINTGLWASGRGAVEAIDGHRTLTRLKVAAALAILDHRMVVSAVDWELSEVIMAKSDATRDSVIEYDRHAARAKVQDRATSRATFDEMIDDRHATTVRSRILRLLATGSMSRSELRRAMGKQHYREAFDAVLPHLERISQVVIIPGEKASHYALNREFTGEPDSNVTDLDTHRSCACHRPKMSCREWFNNHIQSLRDSGATTAESLAVYAAGEAAGYSRKTLYVAANKSPIEVIENRTSAGSTWRIAPTEESTPA
jgi:hypothetical protein